MVNSYKKREEFLYKEMVAVEVEISKLPDCRCYGIYPDGRKVILTYYNGKIHIRSFTSREEVIACPLKKIPLYISAKDRTTQIRVKKRLSGEELKGQLIERQDLVDRYFRLSKLNNRMVNLSIINRRQSQQSA